MAELTAILGVDTDDWSLREMLWGVEAKRREFWAHESYSLAWRINSMPSFSKRRRPLVTPIQINPYRKRGSRGIRLTTASESAAAALDAWADRAAGKRN